MEEQILKDQNIYPDKDVIGNYLNKEQFNLYLEFIEKTKQLNFAIEWRFYNDGKVWLGKILSKKNIGWLSIWNTGFKVTVFLTEKMINGFNDLDIDNKIKESLKEVKPIGKLIPVITLIDNVSVLNDVVKILEYKTKLK